MKNPQIEEQKDRFDLFPVGTRVKIFCHFQDFYFFNSEIGTVISNSGKYLGIKVEFDDPRCFEDGHIQYNFNFDPRDLEILGHG